MFQFKEVRDRLIHGPTSHVENGVSTKDFPYAIVAKAPPYAFGKTVALICGKDLEDAKNNARQIMQALQIAEGLVTILTEVKQSDI